MFARIIASLQMRRTVVSMPLCIIQGVQLVFVRYPQVVQQLLGCTEDNEGRGHIFVYKL